MSASVDMQVAGGGDDLRQLGPADPVSPSYRRFRPFPALGGAMVASLPNIGHHSVTLDLLRGRWGYQREGILDRTHLRFFTRQGIIQVFESQGLRVEVVTRNVLAWGPMKYLNRACFQQLPERWFTFQYVLRAVVDAAPEVPRSGP